MVVDRRELSSAISGISTRIVKTHTHIDLSNLPIVFLTLYVLVSPLGSLGEVIALMEGTLRSQSILLGSLGFRYLREFILILFITSGLVLHLDKGFRPGLAILGGILLHLITIHVLVRMIEYGIFDVYVAAGIRWFSPVLIPFALHRLANKHSLQPVTNALLVVFLVHFVLQIVQFFGKSYWYGPSFLGMGSRAPGVFLIPNTGAFFSLVVAIFSDYYSNLRRCIKILIRLLVTVSVFLTASGAGYGAIVLYWVIHYFGRKYRKPSLLVMPLMLGALIFILPVVSGRGSQYLSKSGLTRVEILANALRDAGFYSMGFGSATNTIVLYAKRSMDTIHTASAESFYASVVFNFGWSGLLLLIGLLILGIVYAYRNNNMPFLLFFVILVIFSGTSLVTEVRPAGIMAIVGISWAYFEQLRKNRSQDAKPHKA